jgi:hypothetical protein
LLSHGYNSFRLPAAPAVRRSIRKPERPPSAIAYDPMQKLQSQLGKSLSLQLLMTVTRRNLPSDDVIRLQGTALTFLQLLLGHQVRLPAVRNSAQIQKPWPALPRCSKGPRSGIIAGYCEAVWILTTTV